MSNMVNRDKAEIEAIIKALSIARMSTYKEAIVSLQDQHTTPLDLYLWNAEISGIFLQLLHICEVVIRNAISDALTQVYGDKWPWSETFLLSLPNTERGYNPRLDLVKSGKKQHTTGKVIPELKFIFWQKMFTRRFVGRVWKDNLYTVFPNIGCNRSTNILVSEIYNDIDQIRRLRNRIAHYEPIFKRQLHDDYKKAIGLISKRCHITERWLKTNLHIESALSAFPEKLVVP